MRAIAAMLVLAALASLPSAQATGDCVGKPGQVQACQEVGRDGVCAAVGLGLQGAHVCAATSGALVCVGFNCHEVPVTGEAPECVGQHGAVEACTTSDCASAGLGLQGVSVCHYPKAIVVCVGFNCQTVPLD